MVKIATISVFPLIPWAKEKSTYRQWYFFLSLVQKQDKASISSLSDGLSQDIASTMTLHSVHWVTGVCNLQLIHVLHNSYQRG